MLYITENVIKTIKGDSQVYQLYRKLPPRSSLQVLKYHFKKCPNSFISMRSCNICLVELFVLLTIFQNTELF